MTKATMTELVTKPGALIQRVLAGETGGRKIMEQILAGLRRKRDLQQYQVAALVGVKPPMVSKVESGRVKPKTKLEKWARAYGISLNQFKAAIDWGSELPLWDLMARIAQEESATSFIDCRRREIRSA